MGRLRKSYVQRVTVHEKRVEIGLGSTKWTTHSEARAAAQANRKIVRTGGDPRRRPETVPTFEEAADAVIAMHATTWKDGGKTEERWWAILAKYAFGDRVGRESATRYAHFARDSVKTVEDRVVVSLSADANVAQGPFATP